MRGQRNEPNATLSKRADPQQYSLSDENIGNLAYPKVDVVITSPPYSEQLQAQTDYEQRKKRLASKGFSRKTHGLLRGQKQTSSVIGGDIRYSPDPENIGNLKHGHIVDIILTSPPFGEEKTFQIYNGPRATNRKGDSSKTRCKKDYTASEHPGNIGQLPYPVDTVITSPPLGVDPKNQRHKPLQQFDKERGFKPDKSFRGSYGTIDELDKDNISKLREHGQVDSIITSPPFANTLKNKTLNWKRQIELMRQAGISEQRIKTFLGEANLLRDNMGAYSKNPNNIGNLQKGEVDVVITSPPYSDGAKGKSKSPFWERLANDPTSNRYGRKQHPTTGEGYSKSSKNIGNLPHSRPVDAILTSPPYAHEATASKPTKLEQEGLFKMGHSKETALTDEDYRTWVLRQKGNIAKRKLFVRVPCSPEEATHHDIRPGRKGTEWEYTKEVKVGTSKGKPLSGVIVVPQNVIDNIQEKKSDKKGKTETYLEAMLKVYKGMYDVLKPGGLCIIVLKNFIRRWKVVDLIADTEKLCEYVGFKLVKRIKFELPHVSFWRLNYRSQWKRKFPGKPFPMKQFESVYRYETCLVFQKEETNEQNAREPSPS